MYNVSRLIGANPRGRQSMSVDDDSAELRHSRGKSWNADIHVTNSDDVPYSSMRSQCHVLQLQTAERECVGESERRSQKSLKDTSSGCRSNVGIKDGRVHGSR